MRSKSYWVKRTAALEQSLQENAHTAAENIIQSYTRAIENINVDIRDIFKAYVANSEISEGEAIKLLNAAESDKTYRQLLKLYQNTANPQVKADVMNRINAMAYGARISRLEGVKARIYTRLAEAANDSERTQQTLYHDTLQSSYYTTVYNIAKGINAGIDFTVLPQNAIDRVLNEPWFGSNYSSRIWKHNDEFVKTLQETLESGIMEGHSVNRMAEQMLDFVNEGVNNIRMNTERLVRSETAHFMNQGQLAAYEEIGIEKYQFVAALSERTCDICGNLDSEIFYVAEAIEGENFPPLHAQCRCTTVMAGAVPETRIARNPETGETYKVDGDMSFNEWKNSLTDEQKAALKYVDNSAKSDIMKSGSDSVAKEEQRYGRNKSTAINKSYIESGEYRRKFDKITDNPDVNRIIYEKAKEMLYHRSGTLYEDMYWIDSSNGDIIASALNEQAEKGIAKSKKRDDKIARHKNIIAFHTHPQSYPPSASDFNSYVDNSYEAAYVICHDGKIFRYSSTDKIDEELYTAYIAKYLKQGNSDFEAQTKALIKIKANCDIKYWEVD